MRYLYFTLFFILELFYGCSHAPQYNDPVPEHDTFKMYSESVGEERVINIWMPESYKTGADSLPVMYMADGGIVAEDFPHIANTLNELVKAKKIPPLILVGIENTERRRDLSGFTSVESDKAIAPVVGGSKNFRSFIKDELIPEIDRRYRTTDKRSIIGESLSGLFVIETFFLMPDLFDIYIAFDPSLWWNDHYLVKTAKTHLASFPHGGKKLWFAGSSATDIFVHTRTLAEILNTSAPDNLTWKYSDEPKEKHSTIFRATKEKAIIWALNNHP